MTDKSTPELNELMDELPGATHVDHVAIAVPPGALEQQVAAYGLLGFKEVHREEMGGKDQVREVLLRLGTEPALLQLLEPTGPSSPVRKSLDRQGGRGGLHHLGIHVSDIHRVFHHLKRRGFRIIDEAPRPGSRGTTVFFLHPKGAPGVSLDVLIEIVQE